MFRVELYYENPEVRKLKKALEKRNIKVYVENNKIILECDDYFTLNRATEVVEAVNVGFPIEDSLKIFEDWRLEKIDLREYVGKKENHLRRVVSRIIGTNGKAKKHMERTSGTKIIVKEHEWKVYILGHFETVQITKEALVRLITGTPHSRVYKYLQARKREVKRRILFDELTLI